LPVKLGYCTYNYIGRWIIVMNDTVLSGKFRKVKVPILYRGGFRDERKVISQGCDPKH
jgi:hypothetical protein